MRPIDADRALEIVRDQAIAHPNAYHLTNYATLILREAPTLTDLSKCLAFNSTADDKSRTNADRIRAMTDEELADFIGGIFTIERDMWGDYDPRTVVTQEPRVEVRNKEDMLDWLKREVESDA